MTKFYYVYFLTDCETSSHHYVGYTSLKPAERLISILLFRSPCRTRMPPRSSRRRRCWCERKCRRRAAQGETQRQARAQPGEAVGRRTRIRRTRGEERFQPCARRASLEDLELAPLPVLFPSHHRWHPHERDSRQAGASELAFRRGVRDGEKDESRQVMAMRLVEMYSVLARLCKFLVRRCCLAILLSYILQGMDSGMKTCGNDIADAEILILNDEPDAFSRNRFGRSNMRF